MQLLSIICCNVYPGIDHIRFLLDNLASQTFRDFELVLVDAFYTDNAIFVKEWSELRGIQNVIHTPACEDKHVGRLLHWELYNNALLLANGQWVLYYGVYRYLHTRVVQVIAEQAAKGTSVSFYQLQAEDSIESLPDDVERKYGMNAEIDSWPFMGQTGFFSVQRDMMIRQLNGYNEAMVNQHWVDCELGARGTHIYQDAKIFPAAILRLEKGNQGHYGTNSSGVSCIGKPLCSFEANPRCVLRLIEGLPQTGKRSIEGPVHRVVHNKFEWVRCDVCGTLGIENGDAYMAYILSNPALIRAPINICGVGRNLATLGDDLAGLDLASKLDLIARSHDNPRYLTE